MTEYYARPTFRLAAAPSSTKTMLTLFLVTVLIGSAVAVVNQHVRSGWASDSVQTYYRGSDEELAFPKPAREMLSISHVHLFGMPMLLFILCHIFDLTSVRQTAKSGLFVAAFASVLLQIGAPWLVRYTSPSLAPLIPVAYILFGVVMLILVAVPIREMWFVKVAAR